MKTIVIGGGAAGLIAAYFSRLKGNDVILLEKNEKLGKKIYITGKGRCNITNYTTPNEFLNNVVTNNKFLYSCINNFSSIDLVDFLNSLGLKTKVERGNRVFPLSDHASDVTKTFEIALINHGVSINLNTTVLDVILKDDNLFEVITNNDRFICNSVIICTGGVSYPLTGSTGDGYIFARKFGHNITKPKPSLCGLELCGSEFTEMQGLSLKNVRLDAYNNGKLIYSDFGEMLFTHFGISGPIVLSASCFVNKFINDNVSVKIDLKPALSEVVLEHRLINEFSANSNKEISNVLKALMPKSLINLVLSRAKVSQRRLCCEITKEQRLNLIKIIKNLEFKVSSLRPIEEAIVTSGGVSVKEINPKTMESKLIKGLFFAGEVIDVDAFTGGFNLQIAFSTGYTAGNNS